MRNSIGTSTGLLDEPLHIYEGRGGAIPGVFFYSVGLLRSMAWE